MNIWYFEATALQKYSNNIKNLPLSTNKNRKAIIRKLQHIIRNLEFLKPFAYKSFSQGPTVDTIIMEMSL